MRQPIDVASLEKYLSQHVTIETPISVTQFGFGQSNPTYLIKDKAGKKLVMRKKPPGQLMSRSAHKIEREYRVLLALQGTNIPVPQVYGLCEDPTVIGTPFYLMEFLDGRIFEDPSFPEVSPQERNKMWCEAITTLAKLHTVDIDAVGLGSYGRRSGFYNRQIKTWKEIETAQSAVVDVDTKIPVGRVPGAGETIEFFSGSQGPQDRACLIHGDYKIDNLVYHKTEPRVIGILDWEMSTIGHSLSDIANVIQPWTILSMSSFAAQQLLLPFQPTAGIMGLPSILDCLEWYASVAGWDPQSEMIWADAFSLFRMSAVRQGISARHATRQASVSTAVEIGRGMSVCAALTLRLVSKMRDMQTNGRARL
ncbi:uncharacterized protein N7483_011177 [Penicillium malachiteum]|uniref:uncharacterized protein n=1 Tax=Penicillium malachiteum TaxID=1324776 RepID=UPI0025465ABB|nr:uncharacterized protein N7483_011177 [Penicillium malachiteum]KAJ5713996.1 hypothetical protein N7483_011177 [Penicillium malachiteum]